MDGSRVRQNFDNKQEAIQALADLEGETEGNTEETRARRTRLTVAQLADAEAAFGTAAGRNLSAIVSHYLGLEARAKAKGLDLDTAIAFTESHHRHETKEVTILTARAEFTIGLFAGLRPSEIADLKQEDVTGDKIRVSGGKLRRKLKRSWGVAGNVGGETNLQTPGGSFPAMSAR